MCAVLKELLEQKNCFKLICGAGNENLDEVERLVALYAKAGCHFFDLSANEEVLKAAQKGLDFAIQKEEQKEYHFCVSIATKNDQHLLKAKINPEKCKRCEKCIKICPQHAISQYFKVKEQYCIGCLRCKSVCKHGAIEIYQKNKSIEDVLSSIFASEKPTLLYSNPLTLSCIELHASDYDENEVDEIWNYLCDNFDGFLSLCIGRSKLGNEQILARVKRLVEKRKPYTTIIQADGAPMSGGEDDFKTTLQAVSMAEIIQGANLPVYMLLSGGTNSKTAELCKFCGVDFNGIGIGSYARKIVKEFIVREDFFENEAIFEAAQKIASNLIESTMAH